MSFSSRLSNGFTIVSNSLAVLKANKQLIVFPIFSGIAIVLIMGSFVTVALAGNSWNISNFDEPNSVAVYALLFAYYIVNYFIVVFFNTALIHCTSMYFRGEEPTVREGINFAISRIGAIFAWALLAGTVGAILRIIQENSGLLGKIITGLVGIVWGVATFFVVPVIAYENMGPIDAVKRSSQLMKEKWGESLSAGFSTGVIQLIGILIVAVPAVLLAMYVNILIGAALGVLGVLLIMAISSAVQTIFVSAVYHNVQGNPVENFENHFIDNIFLEK